MVGVKVVRGPPITPSSPCAPRFGTAMKTARPPTDPIDVHDLRVGMFVHLDIGWMSHPFPLSSFRITTRGAAGDDPLARPAHRALEPAAERSGGRRPCAGDDLARPAAGARRRRRQRLGPRRRGCDRHRSLHPAARRQRRRRGEPCAPARAGRAAAQARAPARRRAALHAPVRRGGAHLPADARAGPQQAAGSARPGRGAVARDHRQDDRRAGPVHPDARRRRRRQGVDACDERHRHLAPDGPLLRLHRRGDAGPRRRRDAARRRQGRAAAAPAPPRGELLAQRAARLPGARRGRASCKPGAWACRRARRR